MITTMLQLADNHFYYPVALTATSQPCADKKSAERRMDGFSALAWRPLR